MPVDNHVPLCYLLGLHLSAKMTGLRDFFWSVSVDSWRLKNRLVLLGVVLLLLVAGYSLYSSYKRSTPSPAVYGPEYKPNLGKHKDRGPSRAPRSEE
jgi:hypothetical protein